MQVWSKVQEANSSELFQGCRGLFSRSQRPLVYLASSQNFLELLPQLSAGSRVQGSPTVEMGSSTGPRRRAVPTMLALFFLSHQMGSSHFLLHSVSRLATDQNHACSLE